MDLWDWDGDLSANIVKADSVYPVKLNVVPPKAGFAAWTIEGEDPTHEELDGGHGKRCRRHEDDADELAPMTWSLVFQDWLR